MLFSELKPSNCMKDRFNFLYIEHTLQRKRSVNPTVCQFVIESLVSVISFNKVTNEMLGCLLSGNS